MTDPSYHPHILSEEEIDLLLEADSKAADRMLLLYLNRLVEAHQKTHSVLTDHQQREEKIREQLEELGGVKAVKERASFVDVLIDKHKKRSEMMQVVIASGIKWALPLFLGFLVIATWHELVSMVKAALHVTPTVGGK